MNLLNLLDKSLCFASLQVPNCEEAIEYLSEKLFNKGYVKKEFAEEAIKREKIFPTGLPTSGYKVAIPHTDAEFVNKSIIAIASLKEPVLFNVMGSPDNTVPVSVIFLLAIKEKEKHVEVISQLIENVIQDDELIAGIVKCDSGDEIYDLIFNKLKIPNPSSIIP